MLIQAGSQVDGRDLDGYTPLAEAICCKKPECAMLLLDAGAKMTNVLWGIEIPYWVKTIIAKRRSVKRTLLAFIGVLRRRFVVPWTKDGWKSSLPRDMVNLLSFYVWATRLSPQWIHVIGDCL